jgi:hypothetical protein
VRKCGLWGHSVGGVPIRYRLRSDRRGAGGAVSEGSQGRDPVQGAVVGALFGGAFGNAAKALMAAKSVQAGATSAGTVGSNALPSSSPKAAVDVRKFSDYIFKAGANHGKTPVFTRIGFSRTNSEELVEIYTSQAAVYRRWIRRDGLSVGVPER